MRTFRFLTILNFLFILIFLGCGVPMETEFLMFDHNYIPKHKLPEEIEVYFEGAQPDKPYSIIGIIETSPNSDYWINKKSPKLEDYIKDMKKKAAKLGADGIIGIYSPMELTVENQQTKASTNGISIFNSKEYSTVKGQAFVYKK
ncbi:MAG: hypothetical protein PHE49_05640 [bacterium]|nr:hypothetical protein [bacterium]